MADITKPTDEEPKVVLVQPVKHWWESKVIWFNAFVILASLITSAAPALEQHMSPESYGLLTSVVGVINAVLRFNTSRGIIKSDTKVVDND
jgi:hypothetical protein